MMNAEKRNHFPAEETDLLPERDAPEVCELQEIEAEEAAEPAAEEPAAVPEPEHAARESIVTPASSDLENFFIFSLQIKVFIILIRLY